MTDQKKVVGRRLDFGANWDEVVQEWYLGVSPPIPPDVGWRALDALERLWPEYLATQLANDARGIAIIAGVIDRGLILLACETLPGFDRVLARTKSKTEERAALSEATVLASLLAIGYCPVVEPEIAGKRPDGKVNVRGEPVYFETVTPELSGESERARSETKRLSTELQQIARGHSVRIIVDVAAELTHDFVERIADLVREIIDTPSEAVHELPGAGILQVAPNRGSSVDPPFIDMPVMGWPDESGSIVIVRHEEKDERAHRLLQAEAAHFSQDEMNMLMINVSAVPGGLSGWEPLVRRWFQPTRNRRVGAVVLYGSGIEDRTVLRRWTVVVNPFADRPLPEALLSDLAELNNDPAVGGQ